MLGCLTRRGRLHGLSLIGAATAALAVTACTGATPTPVIIYVTPAPTLVPSPVVATPTKVPSTRWPSGSIPPEWQWRTCAAMSRLTGDDGLFEGDFQRLSNAALLGDTTLVTRLASVSISKAEGIIKLLDQAPGWESGDLLLAQMAEVLEAYRDALEQLREATTPDEILTGFRRMGDPVSGLGPLGQTLDALRDIYPDFGCPASS